MSDRVVSIPIGFSSTLQQHGRWEQRPWGRFCFNPYRVFEYVATGGILPLGREAKWFQSLSGFRVRCNDGYKGCGVSPDTFQSLSGFRVRCNPLTSSARAASLVEVSIPIGFSSTLQLSPTCSHRTAWPGFNPYRVFEYVATSSARTAYFTGTTFQSLSGFRVRCNLAASCCRCSERVVFQSLSGFRVRCNFMISLRPMEIYFVSIPIGFSSTLQREKLSGQVNWLTQFQSLSGFRVRCNHFSFLNVVLVLKVSIPIGFSSTLQRHH